MKNLFLTPFELLNVKVFIRSLEDYGLAKSMSVLEQTAMVGEKIHILTNHGEVFTIERKVLNNENGVTPSDIAYGMYLTTNAKKKFQNL